MEQDRYGITRKQSKQVISQPFNSSHPLPAPRAELTPKTDEQPSPRKPTQAERRRNHIAATASTRNSSKRRRSPRPPVLYNLPPKDLREDIRGPVFESRRVWIATLLLGGRRAIRVLARKAVLKEIIEWID